MSACHAEVASSSLASRSIFYYARLAERFRRRIANPVYAGSNPRTVLHIKLWERSLQYGILVHQLLYQVDKR